MDFSQTLNLPKTDFPMKADLPTREPLWQAFWEENAIYRKSLEKEAPRGSFVLHDGPPYSNGNIHLGHSLNKILKDFITRHRTMQGYRSPYVPGWDNHGLPIEVQVMKEFREKKQTWTPETLRKRCRSFAAEWVEVQKRQFMRLGVRGDWEHPYLTMSPAFEAKIVEVFAQLAKRGYVYRGLKPVLWDSANETALANTEAEYRDHTSPSIYVTFPLVEDAQNVFEGLDRSKLSAVIWTTTPWTIPANMALAFHPDFDYTVARTESGDLLLVAEDLREAVARETELGTLTPVRTIKGAQVEGSRFRHPLPEMSRDSLAVLASDYITTDTGTGIVHTAPGHGADDYFTGRRYHLPVLCVVDGRGRYTEDAGPFVGWTTEEANTRIPERLKEEGRLLAHKQYVHSYPHSPRAPYRPLLFRATVQWFVSVEHDNLKARALEEIGKVEWFPAVSENRIRAAIAGRPDWTVSRQRYWGVGIPVFYANGEPVMTEESLAAVVRLVREKGTDAWYEVPPEEILPPGFTFNGVAAKDFVKETDVLDVWFDSGTTSMAVLDSGLWEGLSYPAEVYLEGSDQHRGWFNSSLMLGTAIKGSAPFRQVVTNGFTVDERGIKMSKSKGNSVDPLGVIEQFGADVLRLWVASTQYQEDTRLGENILKQQTDNYRQLRNTFRFLLGSLFDFDPAGDAVPVSEMDLLDRYALSRLQKLVAACTTAFERYDFQEASQAILLFCGTELSAFYLDVLKDRLYTLLPEDPKRRSSQTALYEIASVLARLLAPVLVHTAEEVWQHLPGRSPLSVHLADWPEVRTEYADDALEARFAELLAVRSEFDRQMQPLKDARTLTKSAAAFVTVIAGGERLARLGAMEETLREALIVPKLALVEGPAADADGFSLTIEPAPGEKCERSWFVREDVGADPEFPTLSLPQAAIVRELLRRADGKAGS
ncbi:MAG: isoleucine--tRNA ligase [Capsulimonadales bacterium]|nr:isoleucine--tRNA ligase [Capsulimonadales bacterium]